MCVHIHTWTDMCVHTKFICTHTHTQRHQHIDLPPSPPPPPTHTQYTVTYHTYNDSNTHPKQTNTHTLKWSQPFHPPHTVTQHTHTITNPVCHTVSLFHTHTQSYAHTFMHALVWLRTCLCCVILHESWKWKLVNIQALHFVFILTTCTWRCGQVILVVNDEARNNLPEELGLGLVLTIYEAKGLEFDDVLLYNFFKDSEVRLWRRPPLQRLQGFRGETLTTSSSTNSSRIQRWDFNNVLLYNFFKDSDVRVWWCPPLQFRGETLTMSSSIIQRWEFVDVLLYNFFKDSEVRLWQCPQQLLQGFRGQSLTMSSSTIQRSESDDVLYNFFGD